MQEERSAPLHLLHNIRARLMNQVTEMPEDRLREGRRLRNVGIDAWVQLGFAHDSSVQSHSLPETAPKKINSGYLGKTLVSSPQVTYLYETQGNRLGRIPIPKAYNRTREKISVAAVGFEILSAQPNVDLARPLGTISPLRTH